MSKKLSKTSSRQGLTLLEVIAGIALISTLFVGLLLAMSRHGKQLQLAQLQLSATEAADQLLDNWYSELGSVPTSGKGVITSQPELAWQTTSIGTVTIGTVQFTIVRLAILDGHMPESGQPLVKVDVLAESRTPTRAP